VDTAETVEVTIPARAEFVSVARLTAAVVAGRQGFTYDEIEDLKIAVGEACTSLIVSGTTPGHPLRIRFRTEPNLLEIGIAARGAGIALHAPSRPAGGASDPEPPFDESRLGIFLMQCLVDAVETRRDDAFGTFELRLVKRHHEG